MVPRLSFSFLSQVIPAVVTAVLSLPPDPNGGMAAVLRISSPGPRLCRSMWLASVNSTSSSKKIAINRHYFFRCPALPPSSETDPFLPLQGAFCRCCASWWTELWFGLLSVSLHRCSRLRLSLQRSIPSHWC